MIQYFIDLAVGDVFVWNRREYNKNNNNIIMVTQKCT